MSVIDLAPVHGATPEDGVVDVDDTVDIDIDIDRSAAARAALARVEQRTGVRRTASDRAWAQEWTARPDDRPDDPPDLLSPASASLPVAAEVRDLLPGRALRRGTALAVTGSTTLLLALVAQASRDGAWATAVGLPRLGLVAAAEAGVVLDRFALVPRPGPDAPATIAALVDGMDVVLVGPDAALTDADRRRLVARARDRGAVLLAATPWAGAHVTLDVAAVRWSGVRAGTGWLRQQHLSVERAGRAGARPLRAEVVLPLGTGSGPAAWSVERPVDGADHLPVDPARVGPSRPARPHLRLVG